MEGTKDVAHAHFTRVLGRGTRVSTVPGEVAVYSFPTGPIEGLSSFATVGISERVLLLRRSWRPVRMELVMGGEPASSAAVADGMLRVAERLSSSGHAFLRGDIMTLETPIFAGSEVTTVYAAPPLHWPSAVHQSKELVPPLVVVALIPLVGQEGDYIWSHGWTAFEAKLEALDPDLNLWDLRRAPIVDHG